jgi:hypothetical protein
MVKLKRVHHIQNVGLKNYTLHWANKAEKDLEETETQ